MSTKHGFIPFLTNSFKQKNLQGNGSTTEWTATPGEHTVTVNGDLGGGTATLEYSPLEQDDWTTMGSNTTFGAPGAGAFTVGVQLRLRVTLSGASSPDIYVSVAKSSRK